MTVEMPATQRVVVTESQSDSSDEEFLSQENDSQLAHAVEDLSKTKSTFSHKTPSKHMLEVVSNNQEEEEYSVGGADKDSGEENSNDSNHDNDNLNSGWVDSIAKILKTNKPKKKKTLVLSKAKKLNDPLKAKPKSVGFQVEKEDGVIAEEQITPDKEKKTVQVGSARKKKHDVQCLCIKPNILDKDRERLLSKIATKGVVQLFNAVKQQQKNIKSKLDQAGPLEVKRDKVLKSINKRSFLDHLMGDNSKSIKIGSQVQGKLESNNKTTWDVLRDDFMMSSNKLKDWDKQLETVGNVEEVEMAMEVEQELEND